MDMRAGVPSLVCPMMSWVARYAFYPYPLPTVADKKGELRGIPNCGNWKGEPYTLPGQNRRAGLSGVSVGELDPRA